MRTTYSGTVMLNSVLRCTYTCMNMTIQQACRQYTMLCMVSQTAELTQRPTTEKSLCNGYFIPLLPEKNVTTHAIVYGPRHYTMKVHLHMCMYVWQLWHSVILMHNMQSLQLQAGVIV